MDTPLFIFEDHCESYLHWKEAGFHNIAVVHVDAHLDLRNEGFLPETLEKIKTCNSSVELEVFRKNEDILWDGFHPGNYLYPACLDGTVSRLIWVIPPHLVKGDNLLIWIREELQNWKDITIEEFKSLNFREQRVAGKLAGIDFEVCLLKDLKIDEPGLVWDIDTDFCFDEKDVPWISPEELVNNLREKAPNPLMTTIAYSVNGGYTAPEQKYVGDMIEMEIQGIMQDEIMQGFKLLRKGDQLFSQQKFTEAEEIYDKISRIPFFSSYIDLRLANLYKVQNNPEQSQVLLKKVSKSSPCLILPKYDMAMLHFRRKEYARALDLLKNTARVDEKHFLMSWFISAVINIKQEKYAESYSCWEKIIYDKSFTQWSSGVRSHVLFLAGSTCNHLKKFKEAVEFLSQSIEIYAENHKAYFQRGVALKELGEYDRASRDLRFSLFLKPGDLDSLETHFQLAKAYELMNKQALKLAELRKLEAKDPTGYYATKAALGRFGRLEPGI